jgi:hypothetical protein
MVMMSFYHLRKGDVLSCIGHLDGDTLSFLSVGHDDDVAIFNACNPVTLVTNPFDINGAALPPPEPAAVPAPRLDVSL